VTVVLVSHFMDEAEELCDRVAILDRGRIAALDGPAGLIDSTEATHRLLFRPVGELDESVLAGLAGVTGVSREGGRVTVTGIGDFASAVTSELAPRNGHGGSAWRACASGCATCPERWRSSRSPAAAPRSRPACRPSASRPQAAEARHG
jgi:energy-coupling factor transporter ATP-binding protein EcfA2